MNIIELAKQAGLKLHQEQAPGIDGVVGNWADLEFFSALVAAQEREAIARMFEVAPALVQSAQNDNGGCLICGFTPKLVIEVIRKRGTT